MAILSYTAGHYSKRRKDFLNSGYKKWQEYVNFKHGGYKVLEGYQIRYIKRLFIDKTRINYPIMGYTELDKLKFPKGVTHKRIEHESNVDNYQLSEGGAVPTDALQSKEA